MSPERANVIRFIDWTISVFRQEWVDAEGDRDERRKWFACINSALDKRIEVMKLVAYDNEHPAAKPVSKSKPKSKPIQEPPTI